MSCYFIACDLFSMGDRVCVEVVTTVAFEAWSGLWVMRSCWEETYFLTFLWSFPSVLYVFVCSKETDRWTHKESTSLLPCAQKIFYCEGCQTIKARLDNMNVKQHIVHPKNNHSRYTLLSGSSTQQEEDILIGYFLYEADAFTDLMNYLTISFSVVWLIFDRSILIAIRWSLFHVQQVLLTTEQRTHVV